MFEALRDIEKGQNQELKRGEVEWLQRLVNTYDTQLNYLFGFVVFLLFIYMCPFAYTIFMSTIENNTIDHERLDNFYHRQGNLRKQNI